MSGLGPTPDSMPGSMHNNSRGTALLAVTVVTTVFALATCILRYFVRSRINQMIGWEDYFVGLAMLLGIIGASFALVESVTQQDLQSALQFDYLAQPWLNMGSTLSKVSICLFVRRLVARVKVWRIVLAGQIVLLLLVNLAYTFTTLLQCRPLEKLWKPLIPGQCWSLGIQQNIGYFQGAFDVFTQLFIALFPIMIIQDLGVPRNVRWPFYLLSTMSVIIAMLGVLRTYNISLMQYSGRYMFEVITTILAVLGQNLNIISANILPISSLTSKNIRPISQALNDAASAREIISDDTVSILSKRSRSRSQQSQRRQSHGSNVIIEGPQRASLESNVSNRSFKREPGTTMMANRGEVWPLGIIKTVSVEVVEEDAADYIRRSGGSSSGGGDLERGKSERRSGQEDWDRYLR